MKLVRNLMESLTGVGIKIKGNWDGKLYSCTRCYSKIRESLPDSRSNWKKSVRKCRTKSLSRDTTTAVGFIGEQIVTKTLGLDNCNLKLNNFNARYDGSRHSEYGIVEIKTSTFNVMEDKWKFTGIYADKSDTIFFLCMDKDMKNVERVYRIPSIEFVYKTNFSIYKNPSRGTWYDNPKKDYRIDEKLFNDIYHSMSSKDCPVLKDSHKV